MQCRTDRRSALESLQPSTTGSASPAMRTPSRGWRRHDPRSSPGLNRAAPAELSRARRMIPTKSHPVVRSRRPSRRPDLLTARRRAQAAPRVLDGREHDGSPAAEGRRPITRHIAVYPRNLTAANTSQGCWSELLQHRPLRHAGPGSARPQPERLRLSVLRANRLTVPRSC